MTMADENIQGPVERLLPLVERGALILTPNRRMSRYLSKAIEAEIAQRKERSWPTPRILPIDSWAYKLWNQQLITGKIAAQLPLTRAQDLLLWEQVVAQSPYNETLLRPAATAKMAQQASEILTLWQLDPETEQDLFNSNEDTEAFLHWHRAYAALAKQQNSSSPVAQLSSLQRSLTVLPASEPLLVMAGFEAPSPLQLDILGSVAERLVRFQIHYSPQTTQVFACTDLEHELRLAADWAFALKAQDPDRRIAIVVQNLNDCREKAERVVARRFDPQAILPAEKGGIDSYDISAGKPLSSTSLVSTALLALRAAYRPLSIEQWLQLLYSPHLDMGQPAESRSGLVDALFGLRVSQVSLATVKQLVTRAGPQLQGLADTLTQVSTAVRGFKPVSVEAWLAHANDVLSVWGWPQGRSLSSDEYQQHQAWLQAIEDFSMFGALGNTFSVRSALELLARHMQETVYHRQTQSAQVQLLGGLEASGQGFDYLWLVGMGDRQWPRPPRPHPLLPLELQVRLGMPNASVERELDYSIRLSRGFTHSSSHLVISYPRVQDDVVCQLSPLLASDEQWPVSVVPPDTPEHLLFETSSTSETVQDENGKAFLLAGAGNSAALRDQAACPFKAYLSHRLKIRALDEPYTGLTPAEKGTAVHRALEYLWGVYTSQQALLEAKNGELDSKIGEAVELGLAAIENRRLDTIPRKLAELERLRLHKLLVKWLELEAQRPPFEIVTTEQDYSLELGNITWRQRLDRVDRLSDGRLLLIDYKTGLVNPTGWLKPRPQDPQIPLYELTLRQSGPVAGVAVASLRSDGLAFQGVSADALELDQIKALDDMRLDPPLADWAALEEQWLTELTLLANEYTDGRASVDPHTAASCNYCDYAPVCRINLAQKVAL
ncbi:MAG: PD-(D/E)XK nuclease family protein [Pseudomonadales bacterium]